MMAKVDITHVPFKGGGPAMQAMLGGQIHSYFATPVAAGPHVKAGKVKALAVTGVRRHALLPDVPTLEEAGFSGFDGVQWYGIVGPANLPALVVERLNVEINKALATPELRARLAGEALDPMPMSPAEFGRYMQDDIAKWAKLAKARDIHLTD